MPESFYVTRTPLGQPMALGVGMESTQLAQAWAYLFLPIPMCMSLAPASFHPLSKVQQSTGCDPHICAAKGASDICGHWQKFVDRKEQQEPKAKSLSNPVSRESQLARKQPLVPVWRF